MQKTLVIWCNGDASVGDGTLNAKVELDVADDAVGLAQECLIMAFSHIWDYNERSVHCLTQEEYDRVTRCETGD